MEGPDTNRPVIGMSLFYPLLCNYYVTTRCNAKCTFCSIHKKTGIDAQAEDVIINLQQLKKLGIRFVDFTGGEPLLHPDLPDFLDKARSLKIKTTVTTNTLRYPDCAEALKGRIDLLHFSLDGPDAETHDAIRGVPAFDKVMESLEVARQLGEKPDLLFTVTEENSHHLPAMVDLAQRHKRILIVNPVFSYFGNQGASDPLLEGLLQWAGAPYVYLNRAMVRFMKNGGNQRQHPRCRAVTTTLVIDADNHLLLPCYHHAVERLPIGGDLMGVWLSDAARSQQRLEGRLEACQHCAISCYFDPSFTHTLDRYFWLSQASKLKYAFDKYLRP